MRGRTCLLVGIVVLLHACGEKDEKIQTVTPEELRGRVVQALVGGGGPQGFGEVCDQAAVEIGVVPPETLGLADERQARCLAVLAAAADRPDRRARVRAGVIRSLGLDLEVPKASLPSASTPLDVARRALASFAPLLRVEDPDRALRLVRTDVGAAQSLLFLQYVKDVPVFGSFVGVTVLEGDTAFVLRSLGGNYVPDGTLFAEAPRLSEAQAVASVTAFEGHADLALVVPLRLWVWDAALFAPECPHCAQVPHEPRLAWRVVYASRATGGVVADAFVDAETGAILYRSLRRDAEDLRILTASEHASDTCYAGDIRGGVDPWFNEHGRCRSFVDPCWGGNHCWWGRLAWCADPDAEGDDADAFVRAAYRFFKDEFPSDADLGDGHPYYAYVHACHPGDPCPWTNASALDCIGWPDIHVFGTGMLTMDVVGHEAGHTYHRRKAGFVYDGESGANAEHVADMLGTFAACASGIDCDWQSGEDTILAGATGCGRDLSDPPRCGDPDHMSAFVVTTADHGGVHTNCGILDKAGYLAVEGGVHPVSGVAVRGLGMAKVQILYAAAIFGLPENPRFADVADRFDFICGVLVGREPHGITADDCCQVHNAFAAVGIGDADSDCDGTFDATDLDDDGDGIADGADNCPLIGNPDQGDLDGDLAGDACDSDADGDGVPNATDTCPLLAGAQTDTDGDGRGDICEDPDGDGVWNGDDNCDHVPNRDQADLDGDGIGDACEDDTDGDGRLDDGDGSGISGDHRCTGGATTGCDDNCRFAANPLQEDDDGDRDGDACDNCPHLATPEWRDADADGLGDACDPDRDGDGVANDDDHCPDLAGSRTDLLSCPPGYLCNIGCPDQRAIVPGLQGRIEARGRGPLDPAAVGLPVVTFPLDLCAFLDCEDEGLVARELVLDLTFTADLAAGLGMKAPIVLSATLVDEAGRKTAGAFARFVSDASGLIREVDVQLRSTPMPSFALRSSKGLGGTPIPEAAAVPALHLVLLVVAGSEANADLLRTTPLGFSVKGGGGGDAVDELKRCARLGLLDLTAVFAGLLGVIAEVDDPQPPLPGAVDVALDLDDDGVAETTLAGPLQPSPATDPEDGLQPNEVVVVPWVTLTDQGESGAGSFSFVKLSAEGVFRMTLVAEARLRTEPTCGELVLDNLSVHAQPHDPRPEAMFGSLGFTTSVDGHELAAFVVLTQGQSFASLTGSAEGVSVEMTIEWP